MDVLCDGSPWGPWQDGNLTLCFQEIVIFGLHTLFIFIFGGWRVRDLLKNYPTTDASPSASIQFRLTLALNIVCAVLPLLQIIADFVSNQVKLYETIADGYICLAWCVAAIIVMLEHERSLPHDWTLRVWYLLAYMLGAIKLQALVDLSGDSWDFFIYMPLYGCYTILAVIALFFNKKADAGQYQKLQEQPVALDEEKGPERHGNPLDTANVFSRVVFSWLTPLMVLGHQRPLQDADLFDLCEIDTSHHQSEDFKSHWKEEKASGHPSFFRALWRTYRFQFGIAAIWKLISDTLLLTGPTLLQHIIAFLQSPDQPLSYGAAFAFGLLLTSVAQTLAIHVYFFIAFRVGMRLRAGVVTAVYKKAFKLSGEARQKATVGEITNHMSVDAQRLMDTCSYLHMIWSGPVQIVVSLVLLWRYIGPSVLAGVGVMVLTIPINLFMARKLGSYQKEMLGAKDKRTKAVNEVLQGMRIIKFFAWEGSFLQKITGIRELELTILQKSNYIKAFTMFFFSTTPLLVSVFTFTVFALTGGELTASTVFTALALFNILRFPLNMLPQIISGMVEARASIQRLQTYLLHDELDLHAVTKAENPEDAVVIEGGEFKWREGEEPTLRDINLKIRKGSLVAVVGSVGAGKSSLINSLLANIRKTRGSVTVSGSIAFCAQQAWMQNASVKENVLFGRPYDQRKYEETLQACQLMPDIAMLPAGDETEIGEKGINLSGGQKQRVSIARAVYQEADIYLLDDPLSAVDAHVGKAIFNQCITGVLRQKTRILVTHQLQYLHAVDQIIVLKGGRISETGTYDQLVKAGGEFATLVATHVKAPAEAEKPAVKAEAKGKTLEATKSTPDVAGKKLIAAEEREVGSVGWHIYRSYAVALGGIWILGLILVGYALDQSTRVGSDWWLSVWSDATFQNPNGTSTRYYLGVYLLWGGANCAFVLARALVLAWAGLEAARVLHNNMLKRVMRAPMSFFDTTPIGRILNRFSKDQYSVDEGLPRSLGMFLGTMLNVIGAAFVISVATPWFLVAALPLAWLYNWIQRFYLDTSRELQRLDSISKSPIFAHFSETLSGTPTIRAYNLKGRFTTENERKMDLNQRAYFANIAANRWLSVRLESLGTCVVFLSAIFAVINRDNIDPGLAGLSISYALSVTSTLNWLVRMSTDLETQLVAVERVISYTGLTTEAPAVLPYRPPATWPNEGAIDFVDVKLRYRPGLDLVLKGVSAQIRPREKIGVVGRTGAGKSSLMLALFRLCELAEGSISIDGEDISKLGLDDLRSRLSIIPQDPILFEGTVRSNLDPFGQYEDEELWQALGSVHLKTYVSGLDKKLDNPVAENGENLSVGQRQLLCLGRALLKKARILVMDEATAAVDYETDSVIQKTIRSEFKDRTVLTIAHRINTIIDYDRVLVLDAGRVVEFDRPDRLLANPNSVFYGMAHSSGSAAH